MSSLLTTSRNCSWPRSASAKRALWFEWLDSRALQSLESDQVKQIYTLAECSLELLPRSC